MSTLCEIKISMQKIVSIQSLFVILVMFGLSIQKAQATIEIGYRAGVWLNAGKLNSIIQEYNAQNPWQKFNKVHFGLGGRGVIGFQTENFNIFAGLKWLRNTQTSSGTDPSTLTNNSKRLVVHYGGIIFGMQTNSESIVNAGFEFNAFNYYVLSFQESSISKVKSAASTEIINNVNPDLSLFLRFALQKGKAGISLIPALDLPIFHGKNDISDLRKQWKLYAPSDTKVMRGYNFSITLSVLLGKSRD